MHPGQSVRACALELALPVLVCCEVRGGRGWDNFSVGTGEEM